MKIWVLFSIANEYDQPNNNLEAWWVNKPSFDDLARALNLQVDKKQGSADVGRILKGDQVRIGEADYRLREIEEGRVKEPK